MKVHLIRKETIEHFARQNARSRSSFQEWLTKLKYADWENPEDIQATFSSADLLGNGSDRVVFDIGGNNYRMICKYWFGTPGFIYTLNGLAHMVSTMGFVKEIDNTPLTTFKN
jgi:mRNA interferase HigB